ncbi:MAG: pyruvate, phosphate dikinase, partial [Gemmatimonadota bacterium]|nr:pyruvate, phosphate dikinase [Gemmatimonadota bacterium]
MTNMIRAFRDLTKGEQLLAGGKGGTLAQLYQAGYPVPDGLVVLSAAFAGDELTPEAWAQVRTHVARLRSGGESIAFAVRSSALGEDSVQASFAGQFETVLDVRSDEEIRDATRTVRRSRSGERVQKYSRATGIDVPRDVAVVVQRMVPAELSGVLFTADPVSGSRMRMVGSYVRGLGDRLVSGVETGESLIFERPKGQYQGPAELRRHARRLYKLAARLERELGAPQDIEWAIAKGKLYLLQSRPITTLIGCNPATGEWNDSLTGEYLWSNVNFGEAVPDVLTPLSWTVLQLIFGGWRILPPYYTAGNIAGRPYLNISIFATVFRAMGKSRQDLLEAVEGTLFTPLPRTMEIPVIPLSRWSLLRILPKLFRLGMKEKRALKEVPAYLASNPAWCSRMRQRIVEAGTRGELLSLWHAEIKPHVTQSVWAVMASVSHYAGHTTRLRRELRELVEPDDADALISNLSDASGPLASLGPLMGLSKVARGEMERDAYLEQYGHRGPHEFELSVPRPTEDASWFDRQLARFRESRLDVQTLLAKQRAEFDRAWTSFRARYPRKAKSMRRRIADVAPRARRREAVRSEYTRDRWVVRAFAVRAGELTRLGEDIFFLTIDEVLDVLSGEEAATRHIPARRATYERYRALPRYPSVILGRFDPFQWAAHPGRRSDIFDARAPWPVAERRDDGFRTLTGAAGAAGQVEGVVRRLDRPEDGDELLDGEVLVTAQTDIA